MSERPAMNLYLISGFLGSGKTSFMRSVLTDLPHRKIGVIVNDFGSVNIDGQLLRDGELKLVEINNGSVFCACLKGGFIKTLSLFLEQDVDDLFVEASGLADPDNMEEYLKQAYVLADRRGITDRRYRYMGNVCVADAVNFLDYLDIFPVIENQAGKSRFILLNKVDEVSDEEKFELLDTLRKLNPDAYIYETNYGKVPPEILTAHLMPESMSGRSLNTFGNRPVVLILTSTAPQQAAAAEDFCRQASLLTIRMKGFIASDSGMLHVEGVGGKVNFEMISDLSLADEGKLVLIGEEVELSREKLMDIWHRYLENDPVITEE